MYRDASESRPYTIESTEIAGLITKRIESIGAALATIEKTEARDRDEAEYLRNATFGWREQAEELAFLRDHLRPGAHSLSGDEMFTLRMNTAPVEMPSIEDARRIRGLSVNNTLTKDVGGGRLGGMRLF